MSRRRGSRPGTRSLSFSLVALQQAVDLLQGRARQRPVARRVGLAAEDRRLVDERQRLDRAGRADAGLEALLADRLGGALGDAADRLLHLPDVAVRRRVALGVAVGQADHAERQAFGQEHPRAVGDDELGRAPADVDEEERVVGRRELAAHGEVDEAGLLLAGDHVHADAGALPDGGDEVVGIGRLADGAGRHGAHDLGARAVGELGQVLDGRRPRLDGLGREHARPQRLAAQAHHLLLAQDDVEGSVFFDVGDEQLDAVGADVDGGKRFHRGASVPPGRRYGVKEA